MDLHDGQKKRSLQLVLGRAFSLTNNSPRRLGFSLVSHVLMMEKETMKYEKTQ
jgi:hypothetical protein